MGASHQSPSGWQRRLRGADSPPDGRLERLQWVPGSTPATELAATHTLHLATGSRGNRPLCLAWSTIRPGLFPSHRDRARTPTVLLLNTEDPEALRHALPALGDLPAACMPPAAVAAALPALGWQLPAARGAVQQLLAAGDWLQVRCGGRVFCAEMQGGGCRAVSWRSSK